MFSLTKEERLVLFILALVILLGSIGHWFFKAYPQLNDIVNVMDSTEIYTKINVNKAGLQELIDIPYIGPYTAQKILDYRQEHGPFKNLDQIKSVEGIKEKNFIKFSVFLKI